MSTQPMASLLAAGDKRAAWAARAKKFQNAFKNMSGDEKVGFIEAKRAMSEHWPCETIAIRSALNRRGRDKESAQKSVEAKAKKLLTLREKFAAFRVVKNGGLNE
jgi:hypothetical protein